MNPSSAELGRINWLAFGDVLASALPLHWVTIRDEYGTDPSLRYKNTSANLNALTMISKRMEQGLKVSLQSSLISLEISWPAWRRMPLSAW